MLSEIAARGCGPHPGQAPSKIAITKPITPSRESQGVSRSVKRSLFEGVMENAAYRNDRLQNAACRSLRLQKAACRNPLGVGAPRAGTRSTDFGESRSRSEKRESLDKLGEAERPLWFCPRRSRRACGLQRSANQDQDPRSMPSRRF